MHRARQRLRGLHGAPVRARGHARAPGERHGEADVVPHSGLLREVALLAGHLERLQVILERADDVERIRRKDSARVEGAAQERRIADAARARKGRCGQGERLVGTAQHV
jgi:hypothetical protein